METTIINTSKERDAISNFAQPAEYSNHMHNSLMYKYIKFAAKKFNAEQYIKFFQEVQRIKKVDDYKIRHLLASSFFFFTYTNILILSIQCFYVFLYLTLSIIGCDM